MSIKGVKAMTFDTFGTVVDWRNSVIAEGVALGAAKGLSVDWAAFTDAWKTCYRPGMDRVRRGEVPWTNVDDIYRAKLDDLLVEFGVTGLTEAEIAHFNRVWHRLDPWPDSVAGLTRLKTRYVLSTLSNGNFACLLNMGKRAGLPWDCILTAENFRHYKPDPEAYRGAIELLGVDAGEVMMVAAHNYDLRHAASHGMRTAFVRRPTEYGPGQTTDLEADGPWDVVVENIEDLAGAMGT